MIFYIVLLQLISASVAINYSNNNNNSITLDLYEKLIGNGIIHQLGNLIESDPSLATNLCAKDILLWKTSSLSKIWALKMSDANAKFPSGIMTLNLNSFGAYDQCLGVEHEVFDRQIKGKYCSAKLPLTGIFSASDNDINSLYKYYALFQDNVNGRLANIDHYGRLAISVGICVPDSCSGNDIENLVRKFFEIIGIHAKNPLVAVPEEQCHTSDPQEWTAINWVGLSVAIVFIILLISSTCYDLYAQFFKDEKSKHHAVLASFSIYTNTEKLMAINKKSGSLRCIHGIRVLSLFWIILGHRYTFSLIMPMVNAIDFIKWNNSFAGMMILAGSVAVDTFFVLSGLLVAYVLFQQIEKNKSFNLPLYYVHRLLRLTPAFAAMIFFSVSLFGLLGGGPLWSLTYDPAMRYCIKYWWSAILYIQNYVNPMHMCVSQTWYLCIDVQLYILSPILIYPLLKNRKIGIANMAVWIVIAQCTVIILVFLNKWPAAAVSFTENQEDYTKNYYNATHMRATPWLLGFATGYALHRSSKKSYRFNPAVATSLWIVSIVIIGSVIFGLRSIQSTSHEVNHLQDSTYNAFARTAWSAAIIWIIFACVNGYGGPVNWFLSWRLWEILGRFTYAMYLLHPMAQFSLTASSRSVAEFRHHAFVYLYFGDLIMTGLLSYIWIMAFESPFIVLEKAVLHPEKPAVQITKDVEATE